MKNYHKEINWKHVGYIAGIGFGIIIVVAFLSSQIIYPIILGSSATVVVPNVVGLSLAKAKNLLHEDRLHVVVKDSVWSDEIPVQFVLEQSPEDGKKLKQDQAVYLVVSRGSKIVKVPEIIGLPYQEAYIRLRNSNLKTTIIDSLYSERYPPNSVVRCIPAPGNKIEKLKQVKVFLSRGSENPTDEDVNATRDYVRLPGDPDLDAPAPKKDTNKESGNTGN